MHSVARLGVLALAGGLASAANATVLPFNSFGTGGIPAYGDRIVGSPQGGAVYTEGAGWTPNVTLDLVTLSTQGPVSLWSTGYAGSQLPFALGHGSFDVPFRMDFVADAGWNVTLNGFDIGTWTGGSYQTNIRIWDDNGSFDQPNLFSFNSLLLPNTVYKPLTSPVTGSGTVRLYLSNIGSTGLDNVSFSQSVIPEPASLGLVGGAALLLLARRRA